jgi:hypothetical protein
LGHRSRPLRRPTIHRTHSPTACLSIIHAISSRPSPTPRQLSPTLTTNAFRSILSRSPPPQRLVERHHRPSPQTVSPNRVTDGARLSIGTAGLRLSNHGQLSSPILSISHHHRRWCLGHNHHAVFDTLASTRSSTHDPSLWPSTSPPSSPAPSSRPSPSPSPTPSQSIYGHSNTRIGHVTNFARK